MSGYSEEEADIFCNGDSQGFGDNVTEYVLLDIFVGLFVMTVGVWLLIKLFSYGYLSKIQYSGAWMLVWISVYMCSVSGAMSYVIHVYRYSDNASFARWFNNVMPSDAASWTAMVFVGMVRNLVFGFLDNAGLFFGSDYLDALFENLPYAYDANCFAGYGNTYSDFLGAFLGTFCGAIISDITNYETSPLWCDLIGIFFGCLLGIAFPYWVLGSGGGTFGMNRINAKQLLLGNMEKDELKSLILGQDSFQDFYVNTMFKKIDVDESDSLEYEEIRNYVLGMVEGVEEEDLHKFIDDHFGKQTSYSRANFKEIYISMAKKMCNEKYGHDGTKNVVVQEKIEMNDVSQDKVIEKKVSDKNYSNKIIDHKEIEDGTYRKLAENDVVEK